MGWPMDCKMIDQHGSFPWRAPRNGGKLMYALISQCRSHTYMEAPRFLRRDWSADSDPPWPFFHFFFHFFILFFSHVYFFLKHSRLLVKERIVILILETRTSPLGTNSCSLELYVGTAAHPSLDLTTVTVAVRLCRNVFEFVRYRSLAPSEMSKKKYK